MRTTRGALALIALVVLAATGCGSPGTVVDEGQGSIPAVVDDALTISSPDDGAVTSDSMVTVRGTAPDGADVVRDASFGLDQHVTATGGIWSMSVELDEGENLLRFRVGDDKSTEATLRVIVAPVAEATVEPLPEPTQAAEPTPETAAGPTPETAAGPTPETAAEPTDEPEPKPLSVKVTKRTTSVARNRMASITIKTTKGARCSIIVNYKSGPSEAAGLGDKTASSSGIVTWKWKVGGNTTKGTWDIDIYCQKGDRDGSTTTTFRVK